MAPFARTAQRFGAHARLVDPRGGRGTKIKSNKVTAEIPTTTMPLPTHVVLPMQQHIGAQCKPTVKRRDHVDVGTLVGHADARTTADIFSPVSGTVKELHKFYYTNGRNDVAVVIEPDGEQTVDPGIKPPRVHTYEDLLNALKRSGIVGLGGAGFPTDLKMDVDLSAIDTWLVNGAECEPYLTSDYREMVEHPDTICYALKTCLDLSGIKKALICIEGNKPRAIELLRLKVQDDPRIDVCELPQRYPQGAARVIVRSATGRIMAAGMHTTDIGCLLFNVTTMSAIGRFLQTGLPLVRRRITVSGDAVEHPQNLDLAIGTPIREVLDFCGLRTQPRKIVTGGPMMGTCQVDLDYPIVRQNSGLLAFSEVACAPTHTTACIRCGSCINSCPLNLMPIEIQKAYRRGDTPTLNKLHADLCMGCGTCSYVCPARQPLTESTHLAAAYLKSEKRKGKEFD